MDHSPRWPGGLAARRPSGPEAQRPSPDFAQFFCPAVNPHAYTDLHRVWACKMDDGEFESLISKKDWIKQPIVLALQKLKPAYFNQRHHVETTSAGKNGMQCCAFGCNKCKKRKLEEATCRNDSEGSEDEESQIKRKLPHNFHP